MPNVREMQSRAHVMNKGNRPVLNNAAGFIDEDGFSYRDLLQQFHGQPKSNVKKKDQETPEKSNHPAPRREATPVEMLNNLLHFTNRSNVSRNTAPRSHAKKEEIKGDLNNDGIIDDADEKLMRDCVKQNFLKEGSSYIKAADFDDDGRITVADMSEFGLTRYRKSQENSGVTGDINNDGTVSDDDQNLLDQYLDGKVRYSDINNEDVNGDGVVDRNDARHLNNLVQYGKMELPTDILGDIDNDGKIDISDIKRLQDTFDGKESHVNVYNADINGDDIVDQNDMTALKNIISDEKIQKNNGILGDINNDGTVDASDQHLLDEYLDGKVQSIKVNNEDVNGDGVVDRNDARNLNNLVQYGKMETPTGILGDTNNDGRIDAADIDKLNNWLTGKESHVNVYNANVNGDGVVDQNDVTAIENLINYGTINKPEPPPPPPPPAPVPYQQWKSVATARVDVYLDSGLSNHSGNEKVFIGDPLDVLDETDHAYYVRYGVGTYPNYSGYKERWIEKWAIDGANKPAPPSSNPAPPYQTWQTVITNRVPAYQDSGLSIRYGNEEVWVGDPVDVLNETDNAYYVRYGVGKYPNYSEYKERWITKTAISGSSSVNPASTLGYQPWQATILTRMPAYHDSDLTDRRNNEEVWVGDEVTILNENDKAYQMRYWSNVTKTFKERWVDKAALSKTAEVNPAPATAGYQPWEATVQTRMPAYHNSDLTDRRNNEEVWVGDKVTIINESDRAYQMRYWSNVTKTYKERWVDKAALSGAASYESPVDKSGYMAYAHYKKQVYTNPELTETSGYEYVDAKEKVTIVDESDKSYLVRYWSTAIKDFKERWIDKAALTEPVPSSASDGGEVRQKLEQLHSGTIGFRDGDVYKGSGQCRGFANQTYSQLFGLSGINGYSNYNYAASSYPGSHVAGQLYNFGSKDNGAVQQLFSNAQPGAIVQMGRRGRLNSTKDAAYPHTAIVYGVNSDGVEFYEANVAGTNVVKVKFYSWADLAKKNEGFTIYMPDNYPVEQAKPAPPVLPGFVQPAPVTPPIPTSVDYQPWSATVKKNMPAYYDAGLTDRRNNEEVWAGDNVTILDENDRAYKMRYWSNTANSYKERWIDKAALSVPVQPSSSDRIVPNSNLIPNNPFVINIEPRNGEVTRREGYVGEADGVVVSDLVTTKHGEMVSVTMGVHNMKSTNAMLTVYNSDGSVYKTEPIEKFIKWPTDEVKLSSRIGGLTIDAIRNSKYGNDGIKWNNEASATHKNIYIEVPVGSRIEITSDISQSRELAVKNAVETTLDLFSSLVGIATDATRVKERVRSQILKTIRSDSEKLLQDLTEKLAKKVAEKGGEIALNDYVEYCQSVQKALKMDIGGMLLENAADLGVSVGKKAAEVVITLANPAVGTALKVVDLVKEVANVSNIACQLYDMWEAERNHSAYNIEIT